MNDIESNQFLIKDILDRKISLPKKFRMFIIENTSYIYINDTQIQSSLEMKKLVKTQTEVPIFKAFKKIEFIIIEILRVYSVNINSIQDQVVTKMIESLDVNERISIIYEFQIINKDTKDKLFALFHTKSQMEYTFTEMHIKYNKENTLEDKESTKSNLTQLCNDLNECWDMLTESYRRLQQDKNIIEQLAQTIKNDVKNDMLFNRVIK